MDLSYFFIWWLTFFLIGVVAFPLTKIFFKRFFDFGYAFSKTIGLFLISYLAFLGGSLKLLPFSRISLVWVFLLLVTLSLILVRQNFISFLKRNWKILLFQEVLFTVGLALWAIVRSYAPDIRGLEKFMDFGFINSILNGKYLPPLDVWFSGKAINYYWFGHLFSAVPIKVSAVPADVGYNLMLATILGLSLTGIFSLVATLVASLGKKYSRRAVSGGIIAAILVAFAGNLHTPIYLIKKGFAAYWYPDATRFIGYFPETMDKTIHEFPIYSFVVSDLHAHFLDIPLTILFLATVYSILKDKKTPYHKIILGGLILGGMLATNSWDFASYGLTAGIVFVLLSIIKKKKIIDAVVSASLNGLLMAAVAVVAFLPFLINFSSIAEGIKFVHSRTPAWQLGVLWGFPAIMTILFLFFVFRVLKLKLETADIFVLAILASSWILVFIPEVIFVKDIYIASHYRANTMFKLTYQAYIMFYLSAGYVAIRISSKVKRFWKVLSVGFFSLLFTSLLIYPFLAVNSYYGGLKNFQGLSGEAWVTRFYPDLYKAIVWLRKNDKNQAVILEAPGDSYTDYNLVSSYTGLPTVQGWFVHEWLWRGSSKEPQERVEDITAIYETADIYQAKSLLNKYKVRYVVVGTFEKERFPYLNEAKFSKLGKKVFSSGTTSIYSLNN